MNIASTRRSRRGGWTKPILRGLQLVAGLAAVTGAVLAWRESRPFLAQLDPPTVRYERFAGFEARPAKFYELESSFARRIRIESCTNDWVAARGDPAMQEPGKYERFRDACLNIARRNVTIAPASSNDWLVAGLLSRLAGDIPAMSAYLKRSLATGPTEQWLARRRAPLLFEEQAQIDDELRGHIDTQLALLLRTEEGVKSVAQMYLGNRAFRERIISVAETVEPVYQERFLHFVKLWAPQVNNQPG